MEHRTMHRSIRQMARILTILSPLAVLGACGNLTAGGATGEAAVLLSGDAADPVPTTAMVASPTQQGTAAAGEGEGDSPEGEVEVEFKLFLEAADGDLIAMTDRTLRVRVDLQGVSEPEVANRLLPAAAYSALRIVFTAIEVEVDAGLIINGVPVTGPIDVEMDNVSLTVQRSLDLDIRANARAVLVIDLNAASWLQAVDPVTATVSAQVFADLVTVIVR
jgi:hypothetical protein